MTTRRPDEIEQGLAIFRQYIGEAEWGSTVFPGEREGAESLEVALGDGDVSEADYVRLLRLGWRFDGRQGFFYYRCPPQSRHHPMRGGE